MPEKRNIVLITLDSLRADHCSFMGYHRKTTPTIDKMAKKGLYFKNAVAPGTGTPTSLMGIFTGRYMLFDPVSLEGWRKEMMRRRTLAQALSEIGYTTIGFTTNVSASSYLGFNKGFKIFYDYIPRRETKFKIIRKYKFIFEILQVFKQFIRGQGVFIHWENIYEDIINSIRNCKEPFFLWILLLDTHAPYNPPGKFMKYSSIWDVYYYGFAHFWKMRKNKWVCESIDPKLRSKIINTYDDVIRYADTFIERLWNDLVDYDPIFIIHSDHGDEFGEHRIFYHPPMLYETLIHVPLVIYNADVKGVIKKPVSLVGLASTIFELIDEEVKFPSKSLLQENRDWVISKVFDMDKRRVAVRMENWKFITGQSEKDELYNLKKDPYEQNNVIDEYPDLAKEMRKIAELHIKREIEEKRIRGIISRLK